jgi:hypothetical protein
LAGEKYVRIIDGVHYAANVRINNWALHNVLLGNLDTGVCKQLYLRRCWEVRIVNANGWLIEHWAEWAGLVLGIFFGLLLGCSRLGGNLFGVVYTAVYDNSAG